MIIYLHKIAVSLKVKGPFPLRKGKMEVKSKGLNEGSQFARRDAVRRSLGPKGSANAKKVRHSVQSPRVTYS